MAELSPNIVMKNSLLVIAVMAWAAIQRTP